MSYTTVKLRTDLHRKLRHYTIDADKTVQVVVEKAIEDFLAANSRQHLDKVA
jgi:predicted transcriptional regulator